jgi:hypothetical protein
MKILSCSLLFCFILCFSAATAQQTSSLPPVKPSDFADAKPPSCAYRDAMLEGITEKTPADELIIVIARPGDDDTRSNLSRRRLYNVRAYWTQYLYEEYRRKPETVVLAEGKKIKGYGQLEFYVGGNLLGVTKLAQNSDLWVGACYPPDDSYIRNHDFDACRVAENKIFYPCREKKVLSKSRR